ncbi:MAG: metalloregulator ArsR/SmtB family transcription factor [Actinomycetota bacterium]|jgi:ArsR family transcriptional regulator|nr:metalloregulator ArsR/SmtB family transcription factor [Actinomycetota bacterium]
MTRPIYQVKADFFKTLAHPARIRVLELLRNGERSVGELIPEVGLEASHLSQQLGVLRRANVLQSRKEGSTVRYSVTDPRIFELLELAKAILTSTLAESRQLLLELEGLEFVEHPEPPRRRPAHGETTRGPRSR